MKEIRYAFISRDLPDDTGMSAEQCIATGLVGAVKYMGKQLGLDEAAVYALATREQTMTEPMAITMQSSGLVVRVTIELVEDVEKEFSDAG